MQERSAASAPQVSVVMPVYNGEKYLAEAIESILAQTFSDFEFIIVDDGSTDDSLAIARSYESHDNRVRVIGQEQNRGAAHARNCGGDLARGKYIAAMDCDDISLPRRLEQQAGFMGAHPDIGMLGTSARSVDADLKPRLDLKMPCTHADIAFNIPLGWSIIGASLMIRREVYRAVGGYNPRYKVVHDIEMAARIIPRTRCANLPDFLYLYRQHESQIHGSPSAMQEWYAMLDELYRRLWGEAPAGTLERVMQVRRLERIGWAERRRVKRDMTRFTDALVAANWIAPAERSVLRAEMNRRLEQMSPRAWQMFLHWYRYRIKRHLA